MGQLCKEDEMSDLSEVDLGFLDAFQWDIARDIEELPELMDLCSKNENALKVLERVEDYLTKAFQELQQLTKETNNGTS
jgi:hypothetical protein